MQTGDTVGLTVHGDGAPRHVVAFTPAEARWVASPTYARWWTVRTLLVMWISYLLALAIGWRRGDSVPKRWLALALMGSCADFFVFHLPGGAVQTLLATAFRPLSCMGVFYCFVLFALYFPDARPLIRLKPLRILAGVVGLLWGACAVYDLSVKVEWLRISDLQGVWGRSMSIGSVLLALAALAFSWRRAVCVTRHRLAWIGC